MTFHETSQHTAPEKTASDRSFGLVFAGFFTIVALWPLIHAEPVRWWSLGLAAIFLLMALIRPQNLKPLNWAWTKFGLALHMIVTPIIMGAIFFLVVTPVSLLMRVFGKVPLPLRFDPKAASYWLERTPPGPDAQSMRNQF